MAVGVTIRDQNKKVNHLSQVVKSSKASPSQSKTQARIRRVSRDKSHAKGIPSFTQTANHAYETESFQMKGK